MKDLHYSSIEEFNQDYGNSKEDLLFVEELKKAGFNDVQILTIINITDSTCLSCYDGNWKHRCNS